MFKSGFGNVFGLIPGRSKDEERVNICRKFTDGIIRRII